MHADPKLMLAVSLDPALILRVAGLTPDPWQARVARSRSKRLLLNCTRSGGKSTSVAARALHHALFRKKALVLILCPTQRQSAEFLRRVMDCYNALGRPAAAVYESVHKLELANGSRIICLPGKESNIRAFQGVTLLIIDEAARVPDDLYRSVRPMLAASQGELVCLSTPWGQRGFFWKAWHDKESDWERIEVKADQCPRITPQFLAEEEREMGRTWVLQEYFCSFQSMEGLVYPDFDARCGVDELPAGLAGRRIGGLDFGFRNPFAAVSGILDRDGVLWLLEERYERECSIDEHAARLPRGVCWYADPSGAAEIKFLRGAGHRVLRGTNAIRAGIAAVAARIETGRLKILRPACPNLLDEAGMYHYAPRRPGEPISEIPVDLYNHALGAVRYLVSKIDAAFLARFARNHPDAGGAEETEAHDTEAAESMAHVVRKLLRRQAALPADDEGLWEPLN